MMPSLKSIQLSFTFPNSLNNFKEADMNIINEKNKHRLGNKSGPCLGSVARVLGLELQTCSLADLTAHVSKVHGSLGPPACLGLGAPWEKCLAENCFAPN